MKVLVLGAGGLLGSNLVRALLAKGDEVRALVRPSSAARGRPTLSGLDLELIEGDLRDEASLYRACNGVQVVYQAASYYPTETIPAGRAVGEALTETRNLLGAVRRASRPPIERLVFTSTLTTIGFPPPGSDALADEDCPFVPLYPKNPYLMAKAAMEREVLEAAKNGLPAVVVNPTVFFGPYDSRPTSGTQILLIAKRLMPAYVDGPTNVIDVRDVAAGMIRAAERGRIGERYILGNWNTTQRELNLLIARLAGVMAPLVAIPFALARLGSAVGERLFRAVLRRPAPVPAFFVEVLRHMQQYDCSKALRELDYPRSPIEPAIHDALAWFKQNGYL
ncbi:NAD-dependent epimerase/dehydratase family protein [Nitrospira sp. Kam-Ns4a]